jgi:hypothetical protein
MERLWMVILLKRVLFFKMEFLPVTFFLDEKSSQKNQEKSDSPHNATRLARIFQLAHVSLQDLRSITWKKWKFASKM